MSEWKRYWPAVSHSCIRRVRESTLIVFDTKSTPTVGYVLISGTCSFPVKLSKMNRFMIEVFPTDWSPKNTILHFIAGPVSVI